MDEAYIEKSSRNDALDILEELGGWPVILGDKWTFSNFTWYGLAEKANLLGFSSNRILSEGRTCLCVHEHNSSLKGTLT